jgi:hypothetical protein
MALGSTTILAVVAVAVVAVAGVVLLIASTTGDDNLEAGGERLDGETAAAAASDPGDGDPAASDPIVLPLSLELVGVDAGTVETTGATEGPEATSYCNNSPEVSGLVDWQGNRLTEGSGRRRVAQLVARFESSFDAAAYVASSSAIIDCDRWETTSVDDEVLRFSVAEQIPATIFGDETRQFDLEAAADGPELFLRTLLVRSGNLVAQFTFVSANRQDLARIDDLAGTAADELGF